MNHCATYRPYQLLTGVADYVGIGTYFKSSILYLSYITLEAAEASRSRKIDIREKIVGQLVIVVEVKCKTVLDEFKVNTDVPLLGLLPFQLRIAYAHQLYAIQTIEVVAVNALVTGQSLIRRERLRATCTIAKT